jgi:hypothetical protein
MSVEARRLAERQSHLPDAVVRTQLTGTVRSQVCPGRPTDASWFTPSLDRQGAVSGAFLLRDRRRETAFAWPMRERTPCFHRSPVDPHGWLIRRSSKTSACESSISRRPVPATSSPPKPLLLMRPSLATVTPKCPPMGAKSCSVRAAPVNTSSGSVSATVLISASSRPWLSAPKGPREGGHPTGVGWSLTPPSTETGMSTSPTSPAVSPSA